MKIFEKLKIIDVVESGRMMKPFHGIAYYDYEMDMRVTAIVPLNWVIAISRATWAFLLYGSRSIADSPRDAYRQGLKDGRRKFVNKYVEETHYD